MEDNKKELCDCGKVAVWVYAPGYGDGVNPYHCDDCISSPEDEGCSCNFHYTNLEGWRDEIPDGEEGINYRWINKEEGCWIRLDEKGRPYPCAEYMYDEDGF